MHFNKLPQVSRYDFIDCIVVAPPPDNLSRQARQRNVFQRIDGVIVLFVAQQTLEGLLIPVNRIDMGVRV